MQRTNCVAQSGCTAARSGNELSVPAEGSAISLRTDRSGYLSPEHLGYPVFHLSVIQRLCSVAISSVVLVSLRCLRLFQSIWGSSSVLGSPRYLLYTRGPWVSKDTLVSLVSLGLLVPEDLLVTRLLIFGINFFLRRRGVRSTQPGGASRRWRHWRQPVPEPEARGAHVHTGNNSDSFRRCFSRVHVFRLLTGRSKRP